MKSFWYSTCLLFLIFATAGLYGQTTGQITGTVRDNTGAVVPGAEVSVTNVTQGVVAQRVTTNAAGEYLVAGLGAGTYNLEITAKGFKRFARPVSYCALPKRPAPMLLST
jgi:uncharacterized surface anchored protein